MCGIYRATPFLPQGPPGERGEKGDTGDRGLTVRITMETVGVLAVKYKDDEGYFYTQGPTGASGLQGPRGSPGDIVSPLTLWKGGGRERGSEMEREREGGGKGREEGGGRGEGGGGSGKFRGNPGVRANPPLNPC